jgi:hypothetical protein
VTRLALAATVLLALLACGGPSRLPRSEALIAPAPAALAVVPDSFFRGTPHTVYVRRSATNDAERRMLDVAERTPPVQDSARGSARMRRASATGGRERLAWLPSAELELPYAVTDHAVLHFLAISDSLHHRRFQPPRDLGRSGKDTLTATQLEYVASVKLEPTFAHESRTFSGVYVARLSLGWSERTNRGLSGFTAERVVVLDADGRVLAVFGDGRVHVRMS